MSKVSLTLDEVHDLAIRCLAAHGCDQANARAVADTVTAAEGDRASAHGLFRLPGYVAALDSGKVNGKADPNHERLAPSVLRMDGDGGYAPLALQRAREPLVACAREQGVAAMALVRVHHFAALWIEIEALARDGVAAFAFTAYMPSVAPMGGKKPTFGTNPMAFGWPRPGRAPMVFDQASAAMARGEVMLAARDGHALPAGTGIDADGNPTTDPNEVLKGALLPFGGHKGASIALMIELLVGPLIEERASFEAAEADNKDGGPPRGGELLLAIDPARFGDPDGWAAHAERLFDFVLAQDGVRLPADRRYAARAETKEHGVTIPAELHGKILDLCG